MAMDAATEAPRRSLVRKLAEVMASVSHVAKSGRNEFHKYDYATEADITASVRQELAKRLVMLIPSVDACDFLAVTTNNGKTERLCTMRMTFTAHDGESGESIPFVAVGQGQDASDKAAYKAATGATKYALLKLFLIPTGDDPEKDEPPPPRRPAPQKPAAPKPVDHSKIIAAFAGLGVPLAHLEDRLETEVANWTPEHVANLRAYHAEKKRLASESADQKAARLEAEKAEAGIAAEQAKKAAEAAKKATETASSEMRKQIDARMAQLAEEAAKKEVFGPLQPVVVEAAKVFAGYVDRIRAATTPGNVALVVAEAAGAHLSAGDLKALQRTATDRSLVLKDAIAHPPGRRPQIEDKSADVPL